ncbi:hypothetical protein BU14_0308s0006 [Porphyra umbilicalis]|uniref:Uncharacterized protein n=1 Tax=Porphyra umbilicalis TaxID=2786 RepID=A0A1X6NZQ3_PORUM|nr:hypothetical protein BU14_0308s0006 [Porphyra umbilicalis]|eukprot:OSX74089.1 hypothetical protein BU14_0308s0006 [Porphyra umbilicalis]
MTGANPSSSSSSSGVVDTHDVADVSLVEAAAAADRHHAAGVGDGAPPPVVMGVGDGVGQCAGAHCACLDGCGSCNCCSSDPMLRDDCLYTGSETCLASCFSACITGCVACLCCGE